MSLASSRNTTHHASPTRLSEDADASHLEAIQLRRLLVMSLIETATLACLVTIAVPLKHIAGMPGASRVLGPIHGLVFLAYAWTVLETVSGGHWSRRDAIWLFVSAFIPFAGIATAAHVRKRIAAAADTGVGGQHVRTVAT